MTGKKIVVKIFLKFDEQLLKNEEEDILEELQKKSSKIFEKGDFNIEELQRITFF